MNIGVVGVIVGESGRHRREGRVRGAGVNELVEPEGCGMCGREMYVGRGHWGMKRSAEDAVSRRDVACGAVHVVEGWR